MVVYVAALNMGLEATIIPDWFFSWYYPLFSSATVGDLLPSLFSSMVRPLIRSRWFQHSLIRVLHITSNISPNLKAMKVEHKKVIHSSQGSDKRTKDAKTV